MLYEILNVFPGYIDFISPLPMKPEGTIGFLWVSQSVCLSICLAVCQSVRLVFRTFFETLADIELIFGMRVYLDGLQIKIEFHSASLVFDRIMAFLIFHNWDYDQVCYALN